MRHIKEWRHNPNSILINEKGYVDVYFNIDDVLKELGLSEDNLIYIETDSYKYTYYKDDFWNTYFLNKVEVEPPYNNNDPFSVVLYTDPIMRARKLNNDNLINYIHYKDLLDFCIKYNSEESLKFLCKLTANKDVMTYSYFENQPIRLGLYGDFLLDKETWYFGAKEACKALGVNDYDYIAKLIGVVAKYIGNDCEDYIYPEDPEKLLISEYFLQNLVGLNNKGILDKYEYWSSCIVLDNKIMDYKESEYLLHKSSLTPKLMSEIE